MKKMYLIPVLLSIFIGFVIGKTMCDEYHTTSETKTVFENTTTCPIYYLQYGVYSKEENMKKNVLSLPYYIYQIEEDQYHVYIAVSSREENITKLQEYLTSLGYNTYKKEGVIHNRTVVEKIQTLDEMLSKIEEPKTIGELNQKLLETYEEGS